MSKYYLRVNGKTILDLKGYDKYGDLTDFVCLNLFTSDFDTIYDLGKELKKLGALDADIDINKIEIVNFYRNKYYFVTNRPLLKADYPFFDEKAVKSFFNRVVHYNLFFYYQEIEKMLNISKQRLVADLSRVDHNDASKEQYIKLLNEKLANIRRLEVLIEGFKDNQSGLYNGTDEYKDRLNEFIESEIYDKRNGRTTINYQGLLEMAKAISVAVRPYGDKYVGYRNNEPKIKMVNSHINDDNDDIDPDSYMFLENEDFEGLYNGRCEAVIEDQIENLEEKKRRL